MRGLSVKPTQILLIPFGMALLALSSAGPFFMPVSAEVSVDQPVWTADLGASGDEHIETKMLGNPFDRQSGLFFSDTGAVVGYFTTRAPMPGLSTRDQPGQFALRAVFMDGRTGATLAVNDWPARISGTTLLPVVGGDLIVQSDGKVQLFSRDLKLAKSVTLPEKQKYEDRYIKISPGRTVVWLVRDKFEAKGSGSTIERFDAQSLMQLSSREGEVMGRTFSVADVSIVRTYPQIGTRIELSQDGTIWQTILKPIDTWCVGDPMFVSNTQLIAAGCSHVVLVTTTGEVLLDDKYDKAWHIETSPVASRDGRFAAVSVMKTKGGAFDTAVRRSDTRIVVYDLLRKRRIWELPVSPLPHFVYRFALSPDGSLLAVMLDSVVKVYKIPVSAAETRDTWKRGKTVGNRGQPENCAISVYNFKPYATT